MSNIKVSAVVVTLNAARSIEKCLGGIFRQKGDWEIEVVLIDSSSEDGTPDLARKFPVLVHSIARKEFHHGRTRNLGASMTHGEYLVFLQGDAWPANENWLEELLTPFSKNAAVACVYGRQLPKDDCDPVNRFRMRWNYQAEPLEKKKAQEPWLAHRLYFFSTANCAIRRAVWEEFRFPEDVQIFEDTTFAKRVISSGYTIVYSPHAGVVHSHNLSARQVMRRYIHAGYVQAKYRFCENQGRNFRSEGVKYLRQGLKTISREAGLLWAAKFLRHTAAGYIGLTWGRILYRLGVHLK